MKKIFRRLACCSVLGIACIGCFNVEARLPKYMAQRAAELLIEKSGLVLKDETSQNRKLKRKQFAEKLVNFLYSTKKRQHLANWMKNRIDRGRIKTGHVADVADTVSSFTDLFNEIDGAYNDNEEFRRFVNQHFPCWTGTLTCFMLDKKNKANIALLGNCVVKRCKESVINDQPAKRIVGILFTLELVDNWSDTQQICKNDGEDDDAERLKEPVYVAFDPYDCVPVPNTMYRINASEPWDLNNTQGSCMVSTIRNLLYILCRNSRGSTQIITTAMCKGMRGAFADNFCTVPGTASCETLGAFARKILPDIVKHYQPTLDLFMCTLNSLLPENMRESTAIPDKYISGSIHRDLIESILRKLTEHSTDLTVMLNNAPTKLSSDWPESNLIIDDKTVNKKITIAFGRRGAGHHTEIINIEKSTD